jgi:hypothetical protein
MSTLLGYGVRVFLKIFCGHWMVTYLHALRNGEPPLGPGHLSIPELDMIIMSTTSFHV